APQTKPSRVSRWTGPENLSLAQRGHRGSRNRPAERERCSERLCRGIGRDDVRVNRLKEVVMESISLLDCAGRRRSPATLASFHQDRAPRNKGLRYPPDPPTVEEIITVMRATGGDADGIRLRGVIVVLWRAGLRISEALALSE